MASLTELLIKMLLSLLNCPSIQSPHCVFIFNKVSFYSACGCFGLYSIMTCVYMPPATRYIFSLVWMFMLKSVMLLKYLYLS